jgi:hypothetical protein
MEMETSCAGERNLMKSMLEFFVLENSSADLYRRSWFQRSVFKFNFSRFLEMHERKLLTEGLEYLNISIEYFQNLL